MIKYDSVEHYLAELDTWVDETNILRQLLKESTLVETLKWSIPMYTLKNKNVIGLFSTKSYVGLWFIQGIFLSDPYKVLVNAGEGKTKAQRQWRFTDKSQIDSKKIQEYIMEAIQNEKDGKKVRPTVKKELVIPELLQSEFKKNPDLESKFDAFNLTRKREFAEHIAEAKREETKLKRMEKIIPMIWDGIGLNDKYRNC